MPHAFGKASRLRLAGVHPTLVAVAERAITLSAQDFGILEGARTLAAQKANVARGVSKTMHSLHLPQPDGLAHAIDAVPWVGGSFNWSWQYFWVMVAAFRTAAVDLGHGQEIVWGGTWDRWLGDLPDTPAAIRSAEAAYCSRHPGPDFVDGPHFQLGGKLK